MDGDAPPVGHTERQSHPRKNPDRTHVSKSQMRIVLSPHPATTFPIGLSNDMLVTHDIEASPRQRRSRHPPATHDDDDDNDDGLSAE